MDEKKIRIVVDAMGGDNAPEAPVEGACQALKEQTGFDVILVGDEEKIKAILAQMDYPKDRLSIVHTTEVIEMAEPPANAIRHKKDSSIVVGMKMVRHGEAEAFVSSGSTGAVLVGGQILVGRLPGVERPPLACLIPTEKGMSCIIDCGANVDARPSWLVQFAKMGSLYLENFMKVKDPRVAIANIGAEEEKGNALVKETFPLLKAEKSINFTGSVEVRDIPSGAADVIVCDAFVGNVILKMYEGTAAAMLKIVKNTLMGSLKTKIGGLLIKKPFKEAMKAYDASAYGGAPLLGLNGLVVKSHGSAKAKQIKVSVLQCVTFYREEVNEKIRSAVSPVTEEA